MEAVYVLFTIKHPGHQLPHIHLSVHIYYRFSFNRSYHRMRTRVPLACPWQRQITSSSARARAMRMAPPSVGATARTATAANAATQALSARFAAAALSSLLLVATPQMQILGDFSPVPAAVADGDTQTFKFPPIDRSNKKRCTFVSSAMGQANAARDSLYDLRECKMVESKAPGFDLSGALMASGDFTRADFKEAQLSKVYAPGARFDGADFTNGVVDRAYFKGASFRGALFNNAVLSASSFEDADLENADFTDAYVGSFDQRKLCKNPTLKGENPNTGAPTRESAGCPP